jgi:hypothetical protein
MRVAVSERIQAGAENNVLRHALLDRLRQLIFRIPAPRRHERTKGASNRVLTFVRIGLQFVSRLNSYNRHGKGIVKDFRLVKKLVRGASDGNLVRGPAESSLLQRKLSCLRGGALGTALLARTNIPQELPGINAQLVPIIPVKFDGVFAHALCRQRFGRLFEHGKRTGCEFRPLAGLASRLTALIVTQSAGTGIAQEGERVVRAVAILPLDIQAGATRQVHFYPLGIGR